jgi:tRNA(Ile)-lysidine synthase
VLNRFQSFIEENAPEIIAGKTLLALSGGADSVAMGHLFHRAGYRFEIAHVNFGLRSDESNGDEAFVRNLAKKWDVPVHVARPDTLNEAQLHGESVQMAARRLRYGFFKQLINAEITTVCTAHQRTDNLEHLFIYLLRNSPAAWQGIPLWREFIFRPMMFTDAAEIRSWLAGEGVEWREDSSNRKTDYLRNKVRHRILPLIRSAFPEAEDEFADLSRSLSALRQAELDENKKWLMQFPVVGDGRMLETTDIPALMKHLRSLGMRQAEAEKVLSARTGSRFHFNGLLAEVRNAGIWIGKPSRHEIEDTDIADENRFPVCLQAGKFMITMKIHSALDVNMDAEDTWFFDLDELKFPISLRSRRKGERIQPFGMQGSKKISDLLVDAHIAASEKDSYPVLAHADGVLGVAAIRRSATAPVQENTHNILCVKWEISDNHAES